MVDPLAQIINLLQPSASFTKLVTGAGSWTVHRSEVARPFYCAVLDGSFRLTVPGLSPIDLVAGDFVLIPFARYFTTASLDRSADDMRDTVPIELRPGVFRLGDPLAEPDVRMLIGYGMFDSADAALLVSLLPSVVHVRGEKRLTTLMELVDEESRGSRTARDVVLTRLLEVLLIEALRSDIGPDASPGLLRGLSDERLSGTLRKLHEQPAEPWTVVRLATEAGMSRSAFFERFKRVLGIAPMEYLLHWQVSLAKGLLREETVSVAEIAQRTGYSSTSTFSTAFSRYTRHSPTAYMKARAVYKATQSSWI